MKKGNRLFGNIIMAIIILSIALPTVDDIFKPIKQYIPLGFIILILIEINSRIKYKTGKYPNKIRIPTNNDDYYRILPFILGTIIATGGILALIYSEENKILWTLTSIAGILFVISGFLFVPTGIIEIKNNELTFENGSRKHEMKVDKIQSIGFKSSDIILTDINNKMHIVNHMNLTESDYRTITEFLDNRLLRKIDINVW